MSYPVEVDLLKSLLPQNNVKLKKGDHVKVSLGVYEHHGIYSGEGTVIERTQDGIREVPLDDFSEGHYIEVVSHNDRKGKRKSVVKRARSHIGEGGYNLVFNNCEHFANEMVSGHSTSGQVSDALWDISSLCQTKPKTVNFPISGLPSAFYSGASLLTAASVSALLATTFVSAPAMACGSIIDTLTDEDNVESSLKVAEDVFDCGLSELEELGNAAINIVGDVWDGICSLFD